MLSFDAKGSQAANIQFMIQTWPNNYFGGSGPVINATVNDQLTAANTWQTFSVNLGSITAASPAGATWQLEFQINASQWGGAGHTDTLTIDNIVLVHIGNFIVLTSSLNPSTYGAGVTFTATVQTNGVTAGNATGQVVFSLGGRPVQHQHGDWRQRHELFHYQSAGGHGPDHRRLFRRQLSGQHQYAEPGRQRCPGPGASQSPDLHRQSGEWFPKLELGGGKSANTLRRFIRAFIPSVSPIAAIPGAGF